MPAQPLPADLFDFDEWLHRPPMGQVQVVTRNRKKWNIVVRANNVEDNEWAQQYVKENESPDPDEVLLSRCVVQITPGGEVDLAEVEIPDESPIDPAGMRKLRRQMLEAQWTLLLAVMTKTSLTRPEPEAPSSPKS